MLFTGIGIAEKYDYLEEKFRKAYAWLRENDAVKMEPGTYPIDGDDIYAMIQVFETQPEERMKFESHEKCFDIQYVTSGVEKYGVCAAGGLKEKERYPERDLIFYENPELAGWLVLKAGELVVFAPEDAHCPQCMAGEQPSEVRKVVVKIRV